MTSIVRIFKYIPLPIISLRPLQLQLLQVDFPSFVLFNYGYIRYTEDDFKPTLFDL